MTARALKSLTNGTTGLDWWELEKEFKRWVVSSKSGADNAVQRLVSPYPYSNQMVLQGITNKLDVGLETHLLHKSGSIGADSLGA